MGYLKYLLLGIFIFLSIIGWMMYQTNENVVAFHKIQYPILMENGYSCKIGIQSKGMIHTRKSCYVCNSDKPDTPQVTLLMTNKSIDDNICSIRDDAPEWKPDLN
jgi:hypothetical protein